MTSFVRVFLQVAFFAAFATIIGYFSLSPRYEYSPADLAVVKLSFSRAAERVVPCVQLTPEQIAAMPPNKRRPAQCERERLPLTVELEIDGTVVVNLEAAPSGVWKDGPASVYESFSVKPGTHRVTARLRDTARSEGWDYTRSDDVELEAGRYFTVTFRAEKGGFNFR